MSSHTLETGDRVGGLFLMADKTSSGALYELQASGYHFSRDHSTTWTSSKVFLLLIILAGWSGMDKQQVKIWQTSQTLRF